MATFYQLCDYFEYLDDLRESGETNMFGAAPYLARKFDMSLHEARPILRQWQDTFSDEPLEERVHQAQTAGAA
jgi:hypothetical protein